MTSSSNKMDPFEQNLLAVALRYTGEKIPRVTAKGYGLAGKHILEQAHTHNIPIQQDEQLSGLLAQVPLGDEIPESLYVAIAEILAFTYRLSEETLNGDNQHD